MRVSRSRGGFASFAASSWSRSSRQGPSRGHGCTWRLYANSVAPERSTLRTVFRDTFNARAISLIDLPLTKCSRLIRPIVSTTSIPRHPLASPAGSLRITSPRGQNWTPIAPLPGSIFHAETQKPGRPSHTYHSYMLANLRLVLEVEVQAGNQHAAKHSAPGLWTLLDRLGPQCAPWLLRGDRDWGNEGVISEAERRGQAYLFKLRLTKRVKRALERAMRDDDWHDAGASWQGKHGAIRLMGWSRQRRVVLLRRRLAGVMITQPQAHGQLALGFVEIDEARQEAWEYAVLVTSLEAEVVTIGQLYRDRGDCENSFDELKNHWGWGGFTTHDVARCRIMARIVALVFNWWNLFVRLADPDHHREAITSRPLLLQAIGRQTNHAGRATVTITSSHGERDRAHGALTRIAAFFATLRETAEQLTVLDRWYRILSHALIKYLKGRQLDPPRRLQAARQARK